MKILLVKHLNEENRMLYVFFLSHCCLVDSNDIDIQLLQLNCFVIWMMSNMVCELTSYNMKNTHIKSWQSYFLHFLTDYQVYWKIYCQEIWFPISKKIILLPAKFQTLLNFFPADLWPDSLTTIRFQRFHFLM